MESNSRPQRTGTEGGAGGSNDRSPPVIRCEGLTHEYVRGGGSSLVPWRKNDAAQSVTALSGVSLTVARGERIGIAGPSGSGKSTLLHLVAGLATPTSGHVEVAGTDLTTLSATERTAIRHRHVGFVFQRFHLLPSLSARANVALPLVQSGLKKRDRRDRATTLLDRVGLGDRVEHTPGELSGGEQQRVAIARALATDPDVLLADEPTGELDGDTGGTVLEILTNVADDQAVVLASHDEAALDVCDRIYHLVDGRLANNLSGGDRHAEGRSVDGRATGDHHAVNRRDIDNVD